MAGRPRKTIARKFLERLVADETAPPPLRLKAAIVLDKADAVAAEIKRREGFSMFPPRPADEADL